MANRDIVGYSERWMAKRDCWLTKRWMANREMGG
jgi:hypothetical protein